MQVSSAFVTKETYASTYFKEQTWQIKQTQYQLKHTG